MTPTQSPTQKPKRRPAPTYRSALWTDSRSVRKCQGCPLLEVLKYDFAKMYVCRLREEEVPTTNRCDYER
jgi:hypothetical protein